MANSLISMIKGDSTLIDNTEVLNGQLLLDETNKKIYLDDNNERIDFSQGGGETSSDANLAYVEEGTVATRGYAAGAYVIVEGQLYKTLTQINSGTTFITEGVNANVEVTNIGSEVTQLNNDLINAITSSQVGIGTKNFSISNTRKRILCITKKSGAIVDSKEIPVNVLESGDVILLGNAAPVVGTEPTNLFGGTTLKTELLNKKLSIAGGTASSSTTNYIYNDDNPSTFLNSGKSIGLETDLSDTTGASITYNGSNSFTITVTDSTLSLYVY